MNRMEYIQNRSVNSLKIVYEYYKENFDTKKHNPFLSESEFYTYIRLIPDLDTLYIKLCNHYDGVFNVVTILDTKGNIITFH